MTPHQALKQYWGYDQFREKQEAIIESVLAGQDTLALLPTGGGKSICFQVPALCQEGVCLVISPLIALMQDQVRNLRKRGIQAAAIYSGMAYRDIDRILDNAVYGGLKFLYLSPERLTTELAIERIKRMNVNLLAIDEAHCISQWGYDFRPPYLKIAEIRDFLPKTPILALTATATREVVKDIQERLEFKRGSQVVQKSFSRSNLAYIVLNETNKQEKLYDILTKVGGSGVVYARNRKQTRDVALLLQQRGIRADFYHAGLTAEERTAKQEAWIGNKTRIMVSTNAFGMGIDKPDVRVVVHLDLPDNLEAYFQEAGRGGRDEKKAFAILLYNETDRKYLEYNAVLAFPELKEVRQVYQALGSYFQLAIGAGEGQSFDFEIGAFAKTYQFEPIKVFNALKILEQSGWVVLSESVYIPSMVQILVSKEELYSYQLKNQRFELIIKSLMRLIQGSSDSAKPINERGFSEFLKISTEELSRYLQTLHADGILNYMPMKDKPQLTFIRERMDLSNITLDQETYLFRKNRHLFRIKKAIEYAERVVCRSKLLLAYFDETENVAACGVCDVCLGRTKVTLTETEYTELKVKITQYLEERPLSLEELIAFFPPTAQSLVQETIQFMLDENQVTRIGKRLALVAE
jgi:ATP-dependent DNA helicase RecQ